MTRLPCTHAARSAIVAFDAAPAFRPRGCNGSRRRRRSATWSNSRTRETHTLVSIVPVGRQHRVRDDVNGQDVLRWPYASIDEFKARPSLSGIPLLAPWANRLDEQAFYANGKRYAFDMALGNVRGAIPIHGFLQTTDRWQVVDIERRRAIGVGDEPARVLSPPGVDEAVAVRAHHRDHASSARAACSKSPSRSQTSSAEPMPVAIGFHPYFQLTDSTRDDWTIAVGARTRLAARRQQAPDRGTRADRTAVSEPERRRRSGTHDLDDVFGDLVRDGQGRATMSVTGKRSGSTSRWDQTIESVVIYAPAWDGTFICFEPMAAITNALNLAHEASTRTCRAFRQARRGRRDSGSSPAGSDREESTPWHRVVALVVIAVTAVPARHTKARHV